MVSDVFDKEENRMNFIQDVLRLYFGIDAKRRFTLQEIGWDFDITQDSVKRIKNKGIRKMKHPQRSSILTSHIDKDLMERSIKERGKSLDEFMMKLLYPPKEIVEKWVLK